MRNLFLTILMCSCVSINAQILTNNGVTPDVTNSNVLLDGSTNFSVESGAGANVGKGIILPSVNLVNFEFDLTLADGFTFPTYFDGMLVYNNATGTTRTGGPNNPNVASSVTPGFYYFSNPNGATNGNVAEGTWMPLAGGGDVTPPNVNEDGSINEQIGNNIYKTYHYESLGLTWMVENLKEGTSSAQRYNSNNSQVNGYYYTWSQATNACPSGWSLPTQTQWVSLRDWVNSNKSHKAAIWWIYETGSAFAGYRNSNGHFYRWGADGYWWGATSGLYGNANKDGEYLYVNNDMSASSWLTVRCVKK